MSESQATSIAKAIERCLSFITTDNGYLTDAGENVYRGWYAHALNRRDLSFPILAIQPDTESTDSASGTGREFKLTESIRIVAITDDVEYPSDILRDCLRDVRRAFALNWDNEKSDITGVRSPTFSTAEFGIDTENHNTLAALPVGIPFTEKHEA